MIRMGSRFFCTDLISVGRRTVFFYNTEIEQPTLVGCNSSVWRIVLPTVTNYSRQLRSVAVILGQSQHPNVPEQTDVTVAAEFEHMTQCAIDDEMTILTRSKRLFSVGPHLCEIPISQ